MTETDEVLIRRCRRGDERSFDILFDRYKARIYTFILRFVKDQKAAEDILQETFIKVFRKARYFRHRAKFSTWLYTIAANLCKDELKKRKRRRGIPFDEGGGDRERDERLWPRLQGVPGSFHSPREEAEKREMSGVLWQALDELPEHARLVVELHVMHGMRYREVAEILKCPIGTVQSRMHNAVHLLRKKVKAKLRKPI